MTFENAGSFRPAIYSNVACGDAVIYFGADFEPLHIHYSLKVIVFCKFNVTANCMRRYKEKTKQWKCALQLKQRVQGLETECLMYLVLHDSFASVMLLGKQSFGKLGKNLKVKRKILSVLKLVFACFVL